MIRLLRWICLACCLQACLRADDKLKLVNASGKPVLVLYTTTSEELEPALGVFSNYNPFHEFQEADTTRGYQAGLMKDNPNYIAPNNTISAKIYWRSWESTIGKGKLLVYRFEPETVLHTSWDSLRTGQKWNKVYTLTLEQVEARNWVVRLR